MNYIKHLTTFFNHIAVEDTIKATHISLYIAIFQYWNMNRFKNPVIISRDELMRTSKIASYATYHKCMKGLVSLGYLEYSPSYNRYSGTSIIVTDLTLGKKLNSNKNQSKASSKNEQVQNLNRSKNELINELPIYNNKTYINNKNIYSKKEKLHLKNTSSNFEQVEESDSTVSNNTKKEMRNSFADTEKKQTEKSRQKSSAKKEKKQMIPEMFPDGEKGPSLKLVKEYFSFQESSEIEAERFFNYYSSNGWLIGGKTKMEDWKASARNWMLNTKKFAVNLPKSPVARETDRAQNLHANNDKDYAEPL